MSERLGAADRFLAGFVTHAAPTPSRLLASSLHRYAKAEGLDWKGLADRIGCSRVELNRIAVCRPPRPERFLADTEEIADGNISIDRLLPVLRQIQVMDAFAGQEVRASAEIPVFETKTARRNYLIAARDSLKEEIVNPDDKDVDRDASL